MKLAGTLLVFPSLCCAEIFFKETFSDDKWDSRWLQSTAKPDFGKFELSSGDSWKVDADIEQGIQTTEDAKFYAASAMLEKPFSNKGQDLVVQFSVKNVDKPSSFCGGGYIKLLPPSLDQSNFDGESPYEIMFGPDICGYDVSRIHVIFNYKGENLLKKTDIKLEHGDKNDHTHLYTLVVRPDNTYQVFVDQKSRAIGSLFEDWDFPPKEIPDPEDKKPETWVDEEMMDDPSDIKPSDWDTIAELIIDPEATQPEDWDEEDDGKWEPPMMKNPEYKGAWKAKRIKNPAYKGKWVQKTIANTKYDEEVYVRKDIGAVGFELWIVNKGSIFDNVFVGNSLSEAILFGEQTFQLIQPKEEAIKREYEAAKKAGEEDEDEEMEKVEL